MTDITDIVRDNMTYDDDNSRIVVNWPAHSLKSNDVLYIERFDGSKIAYRETLRPIIIDTDTFALPYNKRVQCLMDSIDRRAYRDMGRTVIVFTLNEKYSHYCIRNRDGIQIKDYIKDIFNYSPVGSYPVPEGKFCVGDYVLFNNTFLYMVDTINDDGTYTCYRRNSNNNNFVYLEYYRDGTLTEIGPMTVLVTTSGEDDERRLIWSVRDSSITIANELLAVNPVIFYCTDTRFFDFNRFDSTFSFQKNTKLYKENNSVTLNLPLAQIFATDINTEITYGQRYIDGRLTDSIPSAIDYEKHQFVPMYIASANTLSTVDFNGKTYTIADDTKLKTVTEIDFNLHFRKRDLDVDGWVLQTNALWNNYHTLKVDGDETKGLKPYREGLMSNNADLVGLIGFTDDDINNNKASVNKSFLRLSFYDSPNPNSQSLLYYSTIFLDGNKLKKKYFNNINKGVKPDVTQTEYTSLDDADGILRLGTDFKCFNKYNADGSSEGFYLHLFSGVGDSNVCMPIYMKAEFNHAKFGKTVPFIMPVRGGKFVDPTNTSFPLSYTDVRSDGLSSDMALLKEDMYIKLFVKYDYSRNQFVYFLPQTLDNCNGVLEFNLYEPRIIGEITTAANSLHYYRGKVFDVATGEYEPRMGTIPVYISLPDTTVFSKIINVNENNNPFTYTGTTSSINYYVKENNKHYEASGIVVDNTVLGGGYQDFDIPITMKPFGGLKITLKFRLSDVVFAAIEDSNSHIMYMSLVNSSNNETSIKRNIGITDRRFTNEFIEQEVYTPGVYILTPALFIDEEDVTSTYKWRMTIGGKENQKIEVKDRENHEYTVNIEVYKDSIDEKAISDFNYYIMNNKWNQNILIDNPLIVKVSQLTEGDTVGTLISEVEYTAPNDITVDMGGGVASAFYYVTNATPLKVYRYNKVYMTYRYSNENTRSIDTIRSLSSDSLKQIFGNQMENVNVVTLPDVSVNVLLMSKRQNAVGIDIIKETVAGDADRVTCRFYFNVYIPDGSNGQTLIHDATIHYAFGGPPGYDEDNEINSSPASMPIETTSNIIYYTVEYSNYETVRGQANADKDGMDIHIDVPLKKSTGGTGGDDHTEDCAGFITLQLTVNSENTIDLPTNIFCKAQGLDFQNENDADLMFSPSLLDGDNIYATTFAVKEYMLNYALFFDNEVQWKFPLDDGEFEKVWFDPGENVIYLDENKINSEEQIHIGKLWIKRLYGGN